MGGETKYYTSPYLRMSVLRLRNSVSTKRQEFDDSQMCVFGHAKFLKSNMLILLENMSNWLVAHELLIIDNDNRFDMGNLL